MAVVVGIFPDHDALTKLADSLKAGGLAVNQLTVISSRDLPEGLIDDGVRFVMSGEAEDSTIGLGQGIITGQGTTVPGLTDASERIELFEEPPTVEALGDLNVPDGRTDDYLNALESGRCVAGYYANGDVDKIKTSFASAGGNPVEVF